MGFQSVQMQYRAKLAAVPQIAPYYGLSSSIDITSSLVLNLTGRGPTPGVINTTFSLNALPGSGMYMYFAYPAAYGPASFVDQDNGFVGGWDGANNDPDNIWGPATVSVNYAGKDILFYVYRTDYPELGPCNWAVRPDI